MFTEGNPGLIMSYTRCNKLHPSLINIDERINYRTKFAGILP